MEYVIGVLSALVAIFVIKNLGQKRKMQTIERENETNSIKFKLMEFAARELKIKNDVDRKSLDELVNRKRDGDGDDTKKK